MFDKLRSDDSINFFITNGKKFSNFHKFKKETIEKCFEFAWDMSFGRKGGHRNYRSGGEHHRKNGEIFINAFQGKLGECATYNLFINQKVKLDLPDFSVHKLGIWDKFDFNYNGKNVSVKSTVYFGNLLLLESKDWNKVGKYLPSGVSYDYHILTRISPDGKGIMRKNNLFYSDVVSKNFLKSKILSEEWKWELTGYITKDDLKYIIKNNYILPQGSFLNGKVKMDAKNYYIQSGNLKNIFVMIEELKNTSVVIGELKNNETKYGIFI